jgi:Flp pilus assembly pilin Flp
VAAKGRPQCGFARFRATTGGATWLDMTQEYSGLSDFGRVGLVPEVTRAVTVVTPPRTCHCLAAGLAAICRKAHVPPLHVAKEKGMADFLQHIWRSDEGQDIAEYAIMLAVILAVAIGTVRVIGANATTVFSSVGSTIR